MGEKSCLCWQCPHVKECDVEYHRLKLRRKPRMEVEKPEEDLEQAEARAMARRIMGAKS